MSAVADLQSGLVRRFENDPRVVAAIMSQGEPLARLETFWRNVYLRGQLLYDPDGAVAHGLYSQPANIRFPGSRSFVIDPQGTVVVCGFLYHPDKAIAALLDQLDAYCPGGDPGDQDCDEDVDLTDFRLFAACLDGPSRDRTEGCRLADVSFDGLVDLRDVGVWANVMTEP